MNLVTIGHWAFIFGLIISVIAGFGGDIPHFVTILAIAGLIVGFLNVTEKESTAFLVGVIALLLIGLSGLATIAYIEWTVPILTNVVAFISAAGLVVAIKQVLFIAKRSE